MKLRADDGPRYLTAQTDDLSPTGARLRITAPTGRRLRPGQRVHLGIAASPSVALLHADQLIPATIVRAAAFGVAQTVAVRFDDALRQLPSLPSAPLPQAA